MKMRKFKLLDEDYPRKVKVGRRYLEGDSMKQQKDSKKKGDMVTFYEIIKVKNKNTYESIVRIERLEED
jgi:ASC-1-like (ASCH) protein